MNNKKSFIKNKLKGKYDMFSKSGYLQIPKYQDNDNKENIILIQINSIENIHLEKIFLQIIALKIEYVIYSPPMFQYIFGSLNLSEENSSHEYGIQSSILRDSNITIEFSGNYEALDFNISKEYTISKNENTGVQRFFVRMKEEEDLILSINSKKKSLNNNYMFRYYNSKKIENEYFFNKEYIISNISHYLDNKEFIEFEFDNIKILNNLVNNNITFEIYCYLFLKEKNSESLKSLSFIENEFKYQKNIIVNSLEKKFRIKFDDINIDLNKKFIMQMKINIANRTDYYQNDILIYILDADLTKYFINFKKYIIIAGVIIIIFILFAIIYIYINYKNLTLEKKVRAISFVKETESENKEENVLFI